MHSKRSYKISPVGRILGQLEYFRNYKGFSIIFPNILDAIWSFTKVWEFFLFLSPSHFRTLKCKVLFFYEKIDKNWVQSQKINLKKIVGNLSLR